MATTPCGSSQGMESACCQMVQWLLTSNFLWAEVDIEDLICGESSLFPNGASNLHTEFWYIGKTGRLLLWHNSVKGCNIAMQHVHTAETNIILYNLIENIWNRLKPTCFVYARGAQAPEKLWLCNQYKNTARYCTSARVSGSVSAARPVLRSMPHAGSKEYKTLTKTFQMRNAQSLTCNFFNVRI